MGLPRLEILLDLVAGNRFVYDCNGCGACSGREKRTDTGTAAIHVEQRCGRFLVFLLWNFLGSGKVGALAGNSCFFGRVRFRSRSLETAGCTIRLPKQSKKELPILDLSRETYQRYLEGHEQWDENSSEIAR